MALLARAAERKVISTDHLTGKVTTGWEQIERPPSGVQAAVDFGPQVGSLTPLQIDADWPAYDAKLHRLAKPDYAAVFWKWLRASARARPARLEHGWASGEVVGWHTLSADEQKALSEGLDTSGGVLVPPSFAEQIMARLPESNLIVLATVRTDVQRDMLLVPRVQPSQTSGMASIYSGSFEVSPVGETPSQSDFDPAYGANAISMRKFRCRTRISNDLLADAGPYFQAEIARLAAADLAAFYTGQMLIGAGNVLEWAGILNTPGIATTDLSGTTPHSISNTTASLGSVTPFRALISSLPPQYRAGASFIFSESVEAALAALTNGVGHQELQFWRDGQDFLLERHAYHLTNRMPPNGQAGNVVVFGDLKQAYTVGMRQDLSIRLDTETFGDRDQTQLVIWTRSGAAVTNPDALRIGILS